MLQIRNCLEKLIGEGNKIRIKSCCCRCRHCAAAAKSLQSCPTLFESLTEAHQAPPSLGFSRKEHWSELPCPSPMHESEK